MSVIKLHYKPPQTIKKFIRDLRRGAMFYDWIIGPVGSGKTTGIFFKLVALAKLQMPGPDGIRRTRAVIVRNTAPMLRDTTLVSWGYWFKHGQAGDWRQTDKTFMLRYDDVECEVLFRPLDTPDDVARVLSLEVTFAILDEFTELPKEIIEALAARCGRYPSAMMGGATNWGMWGSSNPSTEDNWWFDYLHRDLPENAQYFLQPSGLSPEAENIENLPGKRQYYTDQMKGKSKAWIKQFVEAEWGFSITGTPVIPSFRADLHIAKERVQFNPYLPLIIGCDPGIAGSALIFGQQETWGRLNVLGELVQSGYGAERIINERLKPYLRNRFPDLRPDQVIISADPAAQNRAQSDEKTVVDIIRRHFKVWTETNNRLPLRLDAIGYFCNTLFEGNPGLLIDAAECPTLVRSLKGGWRWVSDMKKGGTRGEAPEKNPWSHPGDAFGYLCRYYHRQTEREMRYLPVSNGGRGPMIAPPRPQIYHVR